MSKLKFFEDAWEQYLYWQTQDRKTLKKLNALLADIQRSPYSGIGKPEALKGANTGRWSRRISDADRVIYGVDGDTITIYQCKGHYDDK